MPPLSSIPNSCVCSLDSVIDPSLIRLQAATSTFAGVSTPLPGIVGFGLAASLLVLASPPTLPSHLSSVRNMALRQCFTSVSTSKLLLTMLNPPCSQFPVFPISRFPGYLPPARGRGRTICVICNALQVVQECDTQGCQYSDPHLPCASPPPCRPSNYIVAGNLRRHQTANTRSCILDVS